MSASRHIVTRTPVPFADYLYGWLRLNDLNLMDFIERSRRYEQPYRAWEVVRINRNPFFEVGTGFEGYYIGVCDSTDEVLEAVIKISHEILDRIARQFRMEYGFKAHLMQTLIGEQSDPKAMDIWSCELGATIARLRCNLQHNREADLFRIETYRMTATLPPICYQERGNQITQMYSVGFPAHHQKPAVTMNNLNDSDQDAWLVAWSIGRFGHPLIREYLDLTCR
ncbi:MAG: hypothetical protein K8L97_26160 [Anaerolineae bacterium]|nr:hypothetical protein [Anaerolineae bacterium]